MDLATLLLTALGLSMDCFAVAVAGSLLMSTVSHRQVLRASSSFGLFQAGMVGLGWLAGRTIVDVIEGYDHWIAFALLFLVGSRMIYESLESHDGSRRQVDITSGAALIVLSVATSIDALAVGVSLGFLRSGILRASLVIGAVAFLVTGTGFSLGRRVGAAMGRWAGIAGGVVLIGIGVRILVTHLT
jgi:putative Mn2+ efflux pump MntP